MKRKFFVGVAIIAVLALIVYVGVAFFLGSIVKAGVNRKGPQLTQTKVELTAAEISPFNGTGTLTGLYVGNPPGWASDKVFSFSKIHVELQPSSLFREHIYVREIVIQKPELVYETKVVASNVGDLLKNIEAATGGKKEAAQEDKAGSPKHFTVNHLVIEDAVVRVGVGPAAVSVPIPRIEMNDLGNDGTGITGGQLATAIVKKLTAEMVVAATSSAAHLPGATVGTATDVAKKAGEGLKKMLGGK